MREILPSYPEELRECRIGGVVEALIQIDEKGKVEAVVIEKPAHPYLNYALAQALRQWMWPEGRHWLQESWRSSRELSIVS
jgi:TonB family protein